MFFVLSKVFWFLAAPSNTLAILAMIGAVLLFTRWRKTGRVLALGAALGALLLGFSPLPRLMIRTLEDRFPIHRDDGRPVDGIVVLGGGIDYTRGDEPRLTDSGVRMTAAMALARRYPSARIVFSGGNDALFGGEPYSESELARMLFRSVGLGDERVLYEGQSRNTRENAVFTERLARPKPGERWLLVTSAFHMPRAMGSFRAVGFPVEAYPVDFRAKASLDDLRPFRTVAEGLRLADLSVKEWIGLLAYRLAGYTDALLPGPRPGA